MTVLLQIDFPSTGPFAAEMTQAFAPLAESINQETGLIWKIWTENKDTQEAGGVYLFDSTENATNYLTMHCTRLESFGISNIRSKIFQVNRDLSKINHAPL
ncbi:monooxygenase [Acinetobacter sp. ANC 4910]|uniref:monooxygenase n=1 Tax=Acinetobacter sp. ANC 4910 TaxID=2529850 RepID=UPI00103B618C|nr:monooxygenase [Acinetobacter sp. ANC 4910]TCB36777.1 monooxygenase [Acinetobacter sp. ANC 4910]